MQTWTAKLKMVDVTLHMFFSNSPPGDSTRVVGLGKRILLD